MIFSRVEKTKSIISEWRTLRPYLKGHPRRGPPKYGPLISKAIEFFSNFKANCLHIDLRVSDTNSIGNSITR